jgi:hypothetical protein
VPRSHVGSRAIIHVAETDDQDEQIKRPNEVLDFSKWRFKCPRKSAGSARKI